MHKTFCVPKWKFKNDQVSFKWVYAFSFLHINNAPCHLCNTLRVVWDATRPLLSNAIL